MVAAAEPGMRTMWIETQQKGRIDARQPMQRKLYRATANCLTAPGDNVESSKRRSVTIRL